MKVSIGSKIKKVRELRNFTQDYVAEKLEMTQAGYSKLEQVVVDVSYTKLEQIAKVLNTKVADIISFDEKQMITNQFNNHSTVTESYIFSDKLVLDIIEKTHASQVASL